MLPVTALVPVAQCCEELGQEGAAGARHRRAAERRIRDHLVQRRFRVVVELRVVVERAVPIADVGFVPQLPQPARRDVGVAFIRVRGPRADELRPFRVVGRADRSSRRRVSWCWRCGKESGASRAPGA